MSLTITSRVGKKFILYLPREIVRALRIKDDEVKISDAIYFLIISINFSSLY